MLFTSLLWIIWAHFILSINAISQSDLFAKYGFPPANSTVKDYEFNVTETYIAPDGRYRTGLLINGQQPGPPIISNQGDWIRVKIRNYTPVDITIHFHGILQKGTPWADGVGGVSQFPIISNDEYTHVFQIVDQYGAAWYHAHYRGYENDGINGPIYTIPSSDVARPYTEITNDSDTLSTFIELELNPTSIISTDWFKLPEDALQSRLFEFGVDPSCIQSILINGKGRISCYTAQQFNESFTWRLAGYTATFGGQSHYDTMGCLDLSVIDNVTDLYIDKVALEAPGYSPMCQQTNSKREIVYTNGQSWMYINFFNMGGEFGKLFSIDGHILYLIAIDGTFIHPIVSNQINVPIGGRFTILAKVDDDDCDKSKPFAIRIASSDLPQVIEGLAYLVYGFQNSTNETEIQEIIDPSNGIKYQDIAGNLLNTSFNATSFLDTLPYDASLVPPTIPADVTINFLLNRAGLIGFSMLPDGYEMPDSMELETPLIFQEIENNSYSFANFPDVVDKGIELGDVVDLIIDNSKTAAHPIHLHGHYVYIVSYSAEEYFPYDSIAEAKLDNYTGLTLSNSPRVDVFTVPPGGHAVIRFVSDNPGFWPLHCHITNHLFSGMMAVLVEAKYDLPQVPKFLLKQSHAVHNFDDWDITDPRYTNGSLIYN